MIAVIIDIGYAAVAERVLSRYQPPPTIRPTMAVAVYDVVVVVIAAVVALTAALLFTIQRRLGTHQHHDDHIQANA